MLQFAILMACDITAKLLGFAAAVLIVRRFGELGFGQVSLAQSVVLYGLMLATCGMDLYGVTHISSLRSGMRSVMGMVITLRLLLGLAVFGVLALLVVVVPQFRAIQVLIMLFGLTLLSGAGSLNWVAQSTSRSHVYGLAVLCTQGIYFSLVIAGIYRNWDLWTIPMSLVVAESVVAAGLLIWIRSAWGFPSFSNSFSRLVTFLSRSLPIGGAQLLRALALGSDMVLIGILLSIEDVGVYAGVYRIFAFGMSLVAAYSVLLLPRLSARRTESIGAVKWELRRSSWRLLPPAVCCVGIACAAASPLLAVLYTPGFSQAAPTLRVLLVTLGFFLVSALMRNALLALGCQRQDLHNVAAASAVHLGAKLTLIPMAGIAGAALGTCFGEMTLAILGMRSVARIFRREAETSDDEARPAVALECIPATRDAIGEAA